LGIIFLVSGVFLGFADRLWLLGGFAGTNLVCAAIVVIALRNPNHPLLSHRFVKWLGVRSYGIYLYHMPIFFALEVFRAHHDLVNFFVVTFFRFSLSIAFAALSYQYLELPFLRYKSRRRKALQTIGDWQSGESGALIPTAATNGGVLANVVRTTKPDASNDTTSPGG
jgi:peptidoglycan/LPS O-acetylase OafA/YrhL